MHQALAINDKRGGVNVALWLGAEVHINQMLVVRYWAGAEKLHALLLDALLVSVIRDDVTTGSREPLHHI